MNDLYDEQFERPEQPNENSLNEEESKNVQYDLQTNIPYTLISKHA